MEHQTPPDNRAEPAGEKPEVPEPTRDSGLGAAYAILRAVVGDRIPVGPLGPDTVPLSVLVLPIALATDKLVQHARMCQNIHCSHVPPPLLRYRRMRPDAIRNAPSEVHKVLWTHRDHRLVLNVRKWFLWRYRQLAREISTGSLLQHDRLETVLKELGAAGPRVLAATLWASKLEGPGAEALFRSLIPLADGEPPRNPERGAARDNGQLKAKAALRKAVRDLKEAERTAERAVHDLQVKERALDRSKRELEVAQRKHRDAAEELHRVQERLRETDAARQALERDAEKSARVGADLRRDLRGLQQSQRGLELQRSDLARQLAAERREVEHLKRQIAGVPLGADAVQEFLQVEEERIRRQRLISSGGAQARADEEWTAHRKLGRAFLDAYPRYRQPPPVKIRRKAPLRLVALGGSGEVGRSCYLLELGKHRVLVDCGIKPGSTEDVHPAIDRLERIDALILTHAHTDHIGWVPALVRRFGELDIYCSEDTAALLPVMLDDCRRQYIRKIANARDRARYVRNAEIVAEEYEEEHVHAVPGLAITCKFGEEEALPGGGASIRFYPAGHILGAASILIEDESGRRIFFSGDFSSFPQLTVPAARWPGDLGEIDLLVLESTYGDRAHKPLVDSRNELISFIRETTERRQGSVILQSVALGRAQELLSLIGAARRSGEISASVPVHVDGMIRKVNPIYRRLADFDVAADGFNDVSGEAERQEIAFEAQTKPAIIVATSGMLMGGPVVEYARRLLPDSRHGIVLAGYHDEGAPSGPLLDLMRFGGGARAVQIRDENGNPVEFEAARPAKHVGLSSHADQPGLIEYAGRLRPKVIALVHGELGAQEQLRSCLLRTHPGVEIMCGPLELVVP